MHSRSVNLLKILVPQLLLVGILLVLLFGLPAGSRIYMRPLILAGMGLCIASMVLQFIFFLGPLRRLSRLLGKMARGELQDVGQELSKARPDDPEQQLHLHVQHLEEKVRFARDLADGNTSTPLKTMGPGDEMGQALLALRSALAFSKKEEESFRSEEEQRIWISRGLARFGALFNEASDDLNSLSMHLLKELVGFTQADVGALFITGDGGELELEGAFAYDRGKHIRKSYEFGEGLVGRAALEKEPILISEVPPDSMKIRSGLGEDLPSSLLLVPVMLDNEVLGVLELAAFGEFPEYQVEFITQLGASLATTLAKVKANLRTRMQAEELASQELVFREKLEQLEKSYEKALEREKKARKELEELRKS